MHIDFQWFSARRKWKCLRPPERIWRIKGNPRSHYRVAPQESLAAITSKSTAWTKNGVRASAITVLNEARNYEDVRKSWYMIIIWLKYSETQLVMFILLRGFFYVAYLNNCMFRPLYKPSSGWTLSYKANYTIYSVLLLSTRSRAHLYNFDLKFYRCARDLVDKNKTLYCVVCLIIRKCSTWWWPI